MASPITSRPGRASTGPRRGFGGETEFVLSSSGHIESLINPPGNPKARYFVGGDLPPDPQACSPARGRCPARGGTTGGSGSPPAPANCVRLLRAGWRKLHSRRRRARDLCDRALIGAVSLPERPMKIRIEIDCTPVEARQLAGLPDVQPMQERLMGEIEQQMRDAAAKTAPDVLLRQWMGLLPAGVEPFRTALGTIPEGSHRLFVRRLTRRCIQRTSGSIPAGCLPAVSAEPTIQHRLTVRDDLTRQGPEAGPWLRIVRDDLAIDILQRAAGAACDFPRPGVVRQTRKWIVRIPRLRASSIRRRSNSVPMPQPRNGRSTVNATSADVGHTVSSRCNCRSRATRPQRNSQGPRSRHRRGSCRNEPRSPHRP